MSLNDAFELADALSRRPDIDPTPCMEVMSWNRAVVTAMGHRDRNALAILVRAELIPAVIHALATLAATVRYAIGDPVQDPEPFLDALSGRVEASARAMVRAGMATWAAEVRESFLPDGGGPTEPRPDRERRVMAQVFTYLQMHIDGDSRGAIGDELVGAFRRLAGPVRAAVECVDRDELDELLPYPLQFELFETFDVLSAIQRLCTVIRMAGASEPASPPWS